MTNKNPEKSDKAGKVELPEKETKELLGMPKEEAERQDRGKPDQKPRKAER
jgi:hypothetical protein